jgi:tetratricopeptide (TPR) repeat protein
LDIGYFQKSKELAEKAIRIDPLVAIYRNTLGQAYLGLNDQQAAIENFKKAIDLDSKLPFPYNNLKLQYFFYTDVVAFNTLLILQIKNGIEASNFDLEQQKLIDDSKLLADKEGLMRETDETDSGGWRFLIFLYLRDTDELVKNNVKFNWSRENRTSPRLFPGFQSLMYAMKQWKDQVRKDGILALWQAKGFPSQCKAIGEDDFECIHPSGGN